MKKNIQFELNGKPVQLYVEENRMLLWVLRTDLELTGAKYGCGEGYCGACTVLVNNEAIRSCQLPMKDILGKAVVTIEGLAKNGNLSFLQKAFIERDALQCGFCTPGMIMNAYSLLLKYPKPTNAQIIQNMDNNLCRCGAHNRIIEAIQLAAEDIKGGLR
jgi:aerobic-type carbon monoxide dehydrogenase small subunit (CoxS/CutS family)